MKQYLSLLQDILDNGVKKDDRTKTGTISLFGRQVRYDLAQGFPLLTTKKVNIQAIIHELLWFLQGSTNIRYLTQNNVNIWNEWAYQIYLEENKLLEKYPRYSEEWKKNMKTFVQNIIDDPKFALHWGELGPIYGKQWTRWEGKNDIEINQIQNAIDMIKTDPNSRRILVSGWNVGELQELIKNKHHAPPSCHSLFQFMVINEKLSCQLYQRSADVFLGVPFNTASYALLTMMIAQVTGLQLGEFIHTFGDVHIYLNHLDQVNEQLQRAPRQLPIMKLNPNATDIFSFTYNDFTLENYDPHPAIRAQISV